jgi:hypothetical protein
MENSLSIQVGKLISKVESDGSEHVPVWFDILYAVSENDGVGLKKLVSTKPVRSYHKVIREEFKHLRSQDTALHGAYLLASVGHAANIGETTRSYSFKLPYDKALVDALNIVTLKDFKYIDTQDDIDSFGAPYGLNSDGHVYYKYSSTSDHPFVMTHGFCIVETMTYNFGSSNDVTMTCKQVQYYVNNNIAGINVFQDSFLPPASGITQALSDNPNAANDSTNPVTQKRWGSTQTNTYGDGSTSNNGSVSSGLCCSGVSSDSPGNKSTGPGADKLETPSPAVDNDDLNDCNSLIPISIDSAYAATVAVPSNRAAINELLIDSTGCNVINLRVWAVRRNSVSNLSSVLSWKVECVDAEMCAPYNVTTGSINLTDALFSANSLREVVATTTIHLNYHFFDDPCAVGENTGETKTRNFRVTYTVTWQCYEVTYNDPWTGQVGTTPFYVLKNKAWNLAFDFPVTLQRLPNIQQS